MEAQSGALDKTPGYHCFHCRSKSVRETRLIFSEMETGLMTRNGFSLGMVGPDLKRAAIPAW